jgi:hypothetical protein
MTGMGWLGARRMWGSAQTTWTPLHGSGRLQRQQRRGVHAQMRGNHKVHMRCPSACGLAVGLEGVIAHRAMLASGAVRLLHPTKDVVNLACCLSKAELT